MTKWVSKYFEEENRHYFDDEDWSTLDLKAPTFADKETEEEFQNAEMKPYLQENGDAWLPEDEELWH